jgi:hypothetical protein
MSSRVTTCAPACMDATLQDPFLRCSHSIIFSLCYGQVDERRTHCVPSEMYVHSHSVESGFVQITMSPTPIGIPGVNTGVLVLQQLPGGMDEDELDDCELDRFELDGLELDGLELDGLELDGLELDGLELEGLELEGLLLDGFELEGSELEGTLEGRLELTLDDELGKLELLELTELLDETELLELQELLDELLGTAQQQGNQPIIHTPLERRSIFQAARYKSREYLLKAPRKCQEDPAIRRLDRSQPCRPCR